MKIFLSAICLLFCGIIPAQTYEFDLLTMYSQEVNGKSERTIYSNLKNENIFFQIGTFTSSSIAYITDFSKELTHTYKIKKSKKGHLKTYTYKYLRTTKMQMPSSSFEPVFEFDEIASDADSKTIRINIFEDTAKNNIITTQTVTMKTSLNNNFMLYRLCCLHPFEWLIKLHYPGNYIITSGKGTTRGGFPTTTKLISQETAKLKLTIPEKTSKKSKTAI